MAVKQIRPLPYGFLDRCAGHFDRLHGIELRARPARVNFFRFAHHADGVNLRGRRQGSDGDRHGVLAPFGIHDVFEYKGLALALLQATKLPAHQRHKFRVLVDVSFNANQSTALFEGLEVLAKVSIIPILASHSQTLLDHAAAIYQPLRAPCQAVGGVPAKAPDD
jgi:hypothetical protein